MPVLLRCDCGKQLKVDDDKAGRKVRCPGCKSILTVPEGKDETEAIQTSPRRSRPAPDEEEEPRRKRRSRQEDEDEEDEDEDEKDDTDREEDEEDVDEDRELDDGWVYANCYNCNRRRVCMVGCFWAGIKGKSETKHYGSYIQTTTQYKDIRRHAVPFCERCMARGWEDYYRDYRRWGKPWLWFAIGLSILLPLLAFGQHGGIKEKDVLPLIGTFVGVWIPWVSIYLYTLARLKNPHLDQSCTEWMAMAEAREQVARETGADTFFSKQEAKCLRPGKPRGRRR